MIREPTSALSDFSMSREIGLLCRDAEFLPSRDSALLRIPPSTIQSCKSSGRDSSPPKS